jgi:hypothetical protein
MAPRWPQVNNGPEHINEHAIYLKEACNQLQAVERGRQNQVPWNTVQQYLSSTIALIGKVLRQPALSEVLQQIQDAAKCTQNIQRDITVIKTSVGLSTAPANPANFSGGRAAAASWAQIAAQAKGPPPTPPTTKSQTTVTAYRDREVTVKLKDHGIAQRYRLHSAAWTRQQVEAFIRDDASTRSVKVIAAHQLKSGDIQIFTSTTAEATQLKHNRGWLRGLGEHAELVVPTYGVIVHGISTSSVNIKEQEATIQQMLADNHTVIPNAKISHVGWLTKEATLKRASSIVVEFTDPEAANAIIYAGMAWDGHIHQCQLYDRACRVKQCFRCYNYGHIGTQCKASQVCGYCAELHETRHCSQKGAEGFAPRCAVCKGAHTAWSNACPARKKEMGRVEQAKLTRSTYWHVPLKENTTRRSLHNSSSINAAREDPILDTMDLSQTAAQRPQETNTPPATADSAPAHLERVNPENLEPTETTSTSLVPHTLAVEEWETPPQEPQQQPHQLDDPQAHVIEPFLSPTTALYDQSLLPYSTEGIENVPTIQDADAWLEDMANDMEHEWVADLSESEPSPITSMATDTRTTRGRVYKGCECRSHQEIYEDWPRRNANLTISHCMRKCVYCGKDFPRAADVRFHMRNQKYVKRNLEINPTPRGKNKVPTPGWTPRPRTVQPSGRKTRSQSFINSATAALHQW